MPNETGTIAQTEHIPAPPQVVYDLLTSAEAHAAFSGAAASGEATVGGTFPFWGGHVIGKHIELQPAKKIRQEWWTTDWPAGQPPSLLEFNLEEDDGGTKVTMVHSRLPPDLVERFRGGWNERYWKLMKEHFKKK